MYFSECKCIEDVKEIYRTLARQFHPDVNTVDTVEVANKKMKDLNNQYDIAFKLLKNVHKSVKPDSTEPYYTATGDKETKEIPQDFIEIISVIIGMKDIKIELIGRWVWVSGTTKPYKETLKAHGFSWSNPKQAWSWHKPEDSVYHYKNHTMNQIRDFYGSQEITEDGRNRNALPS